MPNLKSEQLQQLREEYENLRDLDKKKQALEELAEASDQTRLLEDNLWIYTKLGELYRDFNEQDNALTAFEQAFEYEPRDPDVLLPYVELLVSRDENEKAADILKYILIHIKDQLNPDQLSWIHQKRALHFESVEDFEQAKYAYEKAVQYAQESSEALEGLLRIAKKVGNKTEVINIQKRIIDQQESAKQRSQSYIEMGQNWQTELNDLSRALQAYKKAHIEDPENEEALERICEISKKLEDWDEATEASLQRSQLAQSEHEEADWLINAAYLFKTRQWEPETALYLLREALQKDPSRKDAFEAAEAILRDADKWSELEDLTRELIEINEQKQNPPPNLLGSLHETLGELLETRLNRPQDALEAFEKAAQFSPDSPSIHESAARVAETLDETTSKVNHLRGLISASPGKPEHLKKLTLKLLGQGKDAESMLSYQAYKFLNKESLPQLEELEDDYLSSNPTIPEHPLTDDILEEFVIPTTHPTDIDRLSRITFETLFEKLGSSPDDLGLGEEDAIEISEDILFTNLSDQIADVLGFGQTPPLWESDEYIGLVNLGLKPRGLIVGDGWLTNTDGNEIAYSLGKAFFLIQKPHYLVDIYDLEELKQLFSATIKIASDALEDHEMAGELSREIQILSSNLSDESRVLIKKHFDPDQLSGLGHQIETWLEGLETTANRIGLVLSNDLSSAEKSLQKEQRQLTTRSISERIEQLAGYMASESYVELRKQLELL